VSGLSSSDVVAFVATTDKDRARAFYEGVLGLRVVHDDSFACVVDGNGTQIRITAVDERAGAEYTVLGWAVDDLDATIDELEDRGVVFLRYDGIEQDDRGIWVTPIGIRVAWFKDPDANTLSVHSRS
jgi:catechol 2,3-dioxygenase-like lactoylglutathione lyase family enzyme